MQGRCYNRSVQAEIESYLFQQKIIILYGARQVGKTTLSKALVEKYDGLYLNCEKVSVSHLLVQKDPLLFKASLKGKNFVVLDEAQGVSGIGEILKLLIDTYPDIQIIATGSSSFDLANKTAEPLTGRKITFKLYPLSIQELGISPLEFQEHLSLYLRYGQYPGIVSLENTEQKRALLDELASDYLYKDVLEFEHLKKSDLLMKLLKALALQLGAEVSYRELAQLLGTSGETITRYIGLLEKSFVIYRVPALSRNLRNELSKTQKIYFYDLGIRNSLLQAFAPLDLRNDVGALWENFCINERLKIHQLNRHRVNLYFWRTYDQQEIDLVEDCDGHLTAWEMKWNAKKKAKRPALFFKGYPKSKFKILNPDTFWQQY